MVLGLFEKLIQIVQSFFRKDSPQVLKVSIENVPMLIEKNFSIKRAELEELVAKKMSEIKYLHSKSIVLLDDISKKELESKINERFDKAALTSKRQIESQLKRFLEKINPLDRGKTIEDARAYSGESYALLVNEVMSFRKSIVYTSIYLKDEMKELGEVLQDMLNIYSEMNSAFLENKELFEFEKIKENVGVLLNKKSGLNEINEKIISVAGKISEKEQSITAQEEKIKQLRAGKEMQKVRALEEEMTGLMNEKQELKTEISSLLLNIDRPLLRFRQLVDSGRWKLSGEEKNTLEQFMLNPILALRKDPKAELFKKVLLQLQEAISEGAVELKDKEKEKRLSALQELINFDFFGKVFWKMNELQKKQNDLNRELEKSEAKKEIEKEESKLKDLKNSLLELKSRALTLENEKSAVTAGISKESEGIKDFAQRTLKKTIIFEEEVY